MRDEDALMYLDYMEKHRVSPPAAAEEWEFLRHHGPKSRVFGEIYGYYAALAAKHWYAHNAGRGVTLGESVRAANIGLIMAYKSFLKHEANKSLSFRRYAEWYIRHELDGLGHT